MDRSIPWEKIHNYLLGCGYIRDHKNFCKYALDKIDSIIRFDQARCYFYNDNHEVVDTYLINVDKATVKEYFDYYANSEGGKYSFVNNRKICNRGGYIIPLQKTCCATGLREAVMNSSIAMCALTEYATP